MQGEGLLSLQEKMEIIMREELEEEFEACQRSALGEYYPNFEFKRRGRAKGLSARAVIAPDEDKEERTEQEFG
jgi:hypothetical protein